jgi:hypothetical protein
VKIHEILKEIFIMPGNFKRLITNCAFVLFKDHAFSAKQHEIRKLIGMGDYTAAKNILSQLEIDAGGRLLEHKGAWARNVHKEIKSLQEQSERRASVTSPPSP